MRGNNVLGIIFSNMHDEAIPELTSARAMGSIPFGGRYRLIDFTLSAMVNAGITKVGVITKSNYQSLIDHLGSGKSWDLSRKRDGLFILPPFAHGHAVYKNRIQALHGISSFLRHSREEYVVISDCDLVYNFDMRDLVRWHTAHDADITVAYTDGMIPQKRHDMAVLSLDKDDRVTNIDIDPMDPGVCSFGINLYMMRRDFLEHAVAEAVSRSSNSFIRDVLQSRVRTNRIIGYPYKSYIGSINSLADYYRVNMDLLSPEVYSALFTPDRPLYTKERDEMPTRYGVNASVKNIIAGDGCVIEGEVENSIIFRSVHIGKGCKVSNSILGQGTQVDDGSCLNCVITDKEVKIGPARSLMGFSTYPVFIGKNITI